MANRAGTHRVRAWPPLWVRRRLARWGLGPESRVVDEMRTLWSQADGPAGGRRLVRLAALRPGGRGPELARPRRRMGVRLRLAAGLLPPPAAPDEPLGGRVSAAIGALVLLEAQGDVSHGARLATAFASGREAIDLPSAYIEALAAYYGRVGAPGVALLGRVMTRRASPRDGRVLAAFTLAQAVVVDSGEEGELREAAVSAFEACLLPAATETLEDEAVAEAAVMNLVAFGSTSSWPLIDAAYSRDAVAMTIVERESVRRALARAPGPEERRQAPSRRAPVRLSFECETCGRVRRYDVFKGLFVTNGMLEDEDADSVAPTSLASPRVPLRERLVVQHPLRCAHCGAEAGLRCTVAGLGRLMDAMSQPGGVPAIRPAHLVSERGLGRRQSWPAAAIRRYRELVASGQAGPWQRVGYANTLRLAGQWKEAADQYAQVVADAGANDADRAEAACNLSILLGAMGRVGEGLAVARQALVYADGGLAEALGWNVDLLSGQADPRTLFDAACDLGMPDEPDGVPAGSGRAGRPKLGRNDPCPCGSGRKYKRCCLAAAAGP